MGTNPSRAGANSRPPSYGDVIEGMERSPTLAGGLLLMFVGGLLAGVAAFADASPAVVLVLAAMIPGGLALAGRVVYSVARERGAGRVRALGYTVRLGATAVLEFAP